MRGNMSLFDPVQLRISFPVSLEGASGSCYHRLLSGESLDPLLSQKGNGRVVGDSVDLVRLQELLSVGRVSARR